MVMLVVVEEVRLTERCWNADNDALARGQFLREVDLFVGAALEELDAGDGVAWLDHCDCCSWVERFVVAELWCGWEVDWKELEENISGEETRCFDVLALAGNCHSSKYLTCPAARTFTRREVGA